MCPFSHAKKHTDVVEQSINVGYSGCREKRNSSFFLKCTLTIKNSPIKFKFLSAIQKSDERQHPTSVFIDIIKLFLQCCEFDCMSVARILLGGGWGGVHSIVA